MGLATKPRKTWLCPKCGTRNVATKSRKCGGCQVLSRPRRRVPKHAQTLRDDSYDVYALLSQTIHGGENEACGVCGRPKPENRRNDRDHDHRTGKPRGLACVRCNRELLRHSTLEEARKVVAYLERVEAHYAKGDEG
jgi:hypothetical protein